MPDSPAKVGRKPKYTPETMERIIAAIRIGASYQDAAQFGGIEYRTFARWMEQGAAQKKTELSQFYQAVKRAETDACLKWLSKIEQAANDGVWQAAAWKLERRYPEVYGRRAPQQVQLSGTIEQHHSGSIGLTDLEKIAGRIPTKLDDWRRARNLPTRAEKDTLTG